jgi:hypothetical protein
MDLARIIISAVLALMLVITGGGKILGLKYATGNRDTLAVHPVFWRLIGVLELAAVVGLIWGIWFIPFGIAAATGVALLMLGAIVFRFRTGKSEVKRQAIADVVVFALAAIVIVLAVLVLRAR